MVIKAHLHTAVAPRAHTQAGADAEDALADKGGGRTPVQHESLSHGATGETYPPVMLTYQSEKVEFMKELKECLKNAGIQTANGA